MVTNAAPVSTPVKAPRDRFATLKGGSATAGVSTDFGREFEGCVPWGGDVMELFESVSVPALILAGGTVAKQLLPLLSERVNKRALRLAKAKRRK